MPKQLLFNKPSIGSWITLGHPAIAEIMAESGFDWLTVDLEHSTITIREAEDLIRIIELKGVIPLVRLTSNSSEQIKRVMDAGAHGVVVPMVCSGDDARAAVAAVRYPPVGKRGVGLARAQGYGSSFETYRSWQANEAVVVVQVEHIDAVNNLEEILSGSMGIPGEFEDPEFVEAMNKIRVTAEQLKVPGGVHLIEPNPAELLRLVEQGNEFIAYSLDIRMIDISCRTGLSQVKKVCK